MSFVFIEKPDKAMDLCRKALAINANYVEIYAEMVDIVGTCYNQTAYG
jgi:hypothetical protein